MYDDDVGVCIARPLVMQTCFDCMWGTPLASGVEAGADVATSC